MERVGQHAWVTRQRWGQKFGDSELPVEAEEVFGDGVLGVLRASMVVDGRRLSEAKRAGREDRAGSTVPWVAGGW